MAFSAIITLTGTVGTDVAAFSLYSNVGSYATAFETGISRTDLINGYTSTVIPDNTSTVKIKSTGLCTNFILVGVNDPNVEVYERCTDGFLAYVLSSDGVDTLKAEDGGEQCYLHIDSGSLTAMQAAYPSMTEVPSLVTSTCQCN